MGIETKGMAHEGTASPSGLDAFQRLRLQMRQKIETQVKSPSLAELITQKQGQMGLKATANSPKAEGITPQSRKAVLHLDAQLPKATANSGIGKGMAGIGKVSSPGAEALLSLANQSLGKEKPTLPGLFAHYGKKQTDQAESGPRLGQYVDFVA